MLVVCCSVLGVCYLMNVVCGAWFGVVRCCCFVLLFCVVVCCVLFVVRGFGLMRVCCLLFVRR